MNRNDIYATALKQTYFAYKYCHFKYPHSYWQYYFFSYLRSGRNVAGFMPVMVQ